MSSKYSILWVSSKILDCLGELLHTGLSGCAECSTATKNRALAMMHTHKHWAMLGVCDQAQRRLKRLWVRRVFDSEEKTLQYAKCDALGR